MAQTAWNAPLRGAWLDSAPPGTLRYTFPGLTHQVREARKIVQELFTGTDRLDDAGLVVDELANNAILYTRSGRDGGWFGVEVAFGSLVRLGVTDLGGAGWLIGATRKPAKRGSSGMDADLDDLSVPSDIDGVSLGGRGLFIVAELAVTTGACGSDSQGHTVWADLRVSCKPGLIEAKTAGTAITGPHKIPALTA
jgi:serine/threonine-protein kinase RsbW